jgi:hypothetical protein
LCPCGWLVRRARSPWRAPPGSLSLSRSGPACRRSSTSLLHPECGRASRLRSQRGPERPAVGCLLIREWSLSRRQGRHECAEGPASGRHPPRRCKIGN